MSHSHAQVISSDQMQEDTYDGLFSHVFNDHEPGHEVKIDCLSEGQKNGKMIIRIISPFL
jgi:hypothetical protein